jgi:hypothetical protein
MGTSLRALRAFAVSGVLVAGLSACSSTVATDSLESEVERLASERGLKVDSVDCPDELPAEVEKSVVCTVTQQDGKEIDVDVTTTNVDGDNVEFDVKQQP